MKNLILIGLFFTLTNLVFSETLTMIYNQYEDFCSIKLFSDDPIKKKFNSCKFYGDWDKRIKPNAHASNVEEYELAQECWGEFLGTHWSLESVLEKLVELGYKPRSAYVYHKDGVNSHNIHTFMFEKN